MIFQVYYSVTGYRTQCSVQETKGGDWVRPGTELGIGGYTYRSFKQLKTGKKKGFSFPLVGCPGVGSGFVS